MFIRLLFFSMVISLATIIHAEETLDLTQIEQDISRWQISQQRLKDRIASLNHSQISKIQSDIERTIPLAKSYRNDLALELEATQKQLDTLGDPPAEDEPPEDAALSKQRKLLNKQVTKLNADIKQLDLLLHNYREFQTQIIEQEKEQLSAQLLSTNPPVYRLDTWDNAYQQGLDLLYKLKPHWQQTFEKAQQKQSQLKEWVEFSFSLMLTLMVVLPIQRWLRRRFGYDPSILAPTYTQRMRAAVIRSLTSGLAMILVVIITWRELIEKGLLDNAIIESTVGGFTAIILSYTIIYNQINALLAPRHPHWRLETINQEVANRLGAHLQRINLAFPFIVLSLIEYLPNEAWSDELTAVYHFSLTVLYVWLLFPLLSAPLWSVEGEPPTHWAAPTFVLIRNLIKITLISLPFIALVGFSTLAFFIVSSTLISAALCGGAWFARRIISVGILHLTNHEVENNDNHSMFGVWLQLIADATLIFGLVLLVLMVWGVPVSEIDLVLNDVFFGQISIGNINFSLIDIVRGTFIFVVALWVTSFIKQFLANHILPRTTIDKASANSLVIIIGYIGFVLSALLTLSALKIDLSNVAIIFGALSVGIGFGLQHIVNNFMSGLILLFQRPFKEGDWIVVGQHEGYVKNVSVIATEIETFDNASVIIPNSQMTTTAVQNWTLHSTLGRVIVPVLVSFKADPEQVKTLLLECLNNSDSILPRPEPYVVLMEITPQGMQFQMRFYIKEIDYCILVGSEMRLAAMASLKKHNIEVPLTQQVIKIEHTQHNELTT